VQVNARGETVEVQSAHETNKLVSVGQAHCFANFSFAHLGVQALVHFA